MDQFKMGTGTNGAEHGLFTKNQRNIEACQERILNDLSKLQKSQAPMFQAWLELWEHVYGFYSKELVAGKVDKEDWEKMRKDCQIMIYEKEDMVPEEAKQS